MTKDEIMALKPGKELDALVGNNVMGWNRGAWRPFENIAPGVQRSEQFQPSTKLTDAWEVVNKFKGYCYLFQIINWLDGKWEAKLTPKEDREFYGIGDTAPEAICKAALLVVMNQ